MGNLGGSTVPLPKQRPGLCAYELRQVPERAAPHGFVEDGLINIANERRDTIQIRHAGAISKSGARGANLFVNKARSVCRAPAERPTAAADAGTAVSMVMVSMATADRLSRRLDATDIAPLLHKLRAPSQPGQQTASVEPKFGPKGLR